MTYERKTVEELERMEEMEHLCISDCQGDTELDQLYTTWADREDEPEEFEEQLETITNAFERLGYDVDMIDDFRFYVEWNN